jgi:hypothetical protein
MATFVDPNWVLVSTGGNTVTPAYAADMVGLDWYSGGVMVDCFRFEVENMPHLIYPNIVDGIVPVDYGNVINYPATSELFFSNLSTIPAFLCRVHDVRQNETASIIIYYSTKRQGSDLSGDEIYVHLFEESVPMDTGSNDDYMVNHHEFIDSVNAIIKGYASPRFVDLIPSVFKGPNMGKTKITLATNRFNIQATKKLQGYLKLTGPSSDVWPIVSGVDFTGALPANKDTPFNVGNNIGFDYDFIQAPADESGTIDIWVDNNITDRVFLVPVYYEDGGQATPTIFAGYFEIYRLSGIGSDNGYGSGERIFDTIDKLNTLFSDPSAGMVWEYFTDDIKIKLTIEYTYDDDYYLIFFFATENYLSNFVIL